jgi:putative transposase
MKRNPDYCALPRKVVWTSGRCRALRVSDPEVQTQWVLQQVSHDWQAFFAAHAEWQLHPDKFLGRPRLPKYKHKTNGRNLLTYTNQAVSKRALNKRGAIEPSGLAISIPTQRQEFDQVRIVPRKTHYVVEVVYTLAPAATVVDADHCAAIDLGLDNLATVTSNQPDFVPLLINGKPLKAINQFYNKERARLQSQLPGERKTSRRLDALTDKRNRRVTAYLHRASRRIIDILLSHGVGTLVIGKNDGWKQNINLGSRTNQNFVQIPRARFIEMLTYKAELVGIQVILTEESYTSKCSFLDREPVGKREVYAGKRVKRWLFRASDGREIHADVNGSLNILRKVIPNAFDRTSGRFAPEGSAIPVSDHAWGIAAPVVVPVRVTPR